MRRNKEPGEADTSLKAAPAEPRLVTPTEIQQKEFGVSRLGGYRMRDVDEFLDELTDAVGALMAENERLRSGASGPVVGTPDLEQVSRQADEIIQRARDEAARIVAEAGGGSAAGRPAASADRDRAAVNAFLRRERDFLQSLGTLVQEHAEAVKAMARQERRAAGSTATSVTGSPPSSATPEAREASKASATSEPSTKASGTRAASAASETGDRPGPAPQEPAQRPQAPARRPPERHEAIRQDEPGRGDKQQGGGDAHEKPAGSAPPHPAAEPDPRAAPTQAIPTPRKDDPVRVDEPEPAGVRRDPEPAVEGDPSLRDLFWGDDQS